MAGVKIPNDWDGTTWICWNVEWPDSVQWLSLLNGFITTPKMGRYWDAETGSLASAQATGREIWDRNTPMEVSLMACNEEALELLADIALAIREGSNMGCCGGIEGVNGGSSGAGMEPTNPSETQDTPESNEGPPPTGFDSWEEFHEKKCDWANKILDDLVIDVATMGAIQITIQTATALAAILVPLLVTPVGWVILLQIAVIMIAAAATSGFYGFISTHLETYRNDYLCALITGTDVTSSIANFGTMVDEKIAADGNFSALTGYWASDILKSLATIDSVNRMYVAQPFAPPTGDCSACEPDALWQLEPANTVLPTLISGNLATLGVVESGYTDLAGGFRDVLTLATTTHPENRYIKVVSIVVDTASNVTVDVYVSDVLDHSITNVPLDDIVDLEETCSAIQIRSLTAGTSDPFQVEFSFEAP